MRKKKNHLNTAARDWSELPKELLHLISERLDNESDINRFRSVCSNWRSSSIPNLNTNYLPFKFPLKFCSDEDNNSTTNCQHLFCFVYEDNNISFCSFSPRNIFLIKPLQLKQTRQCRSVLIRVTQNSSAKTKLSRSPFLPCDLPCPFSIDLTKFSIHHFGTDFIVHESLSHRYIHPVKVVVVTPLIFAIWLDSQDLVLLRHGDERWTEIPYTPASIGDICLFKGRIYTVENYCFKTVAVAPEDLSVQLVAKDVNAAGGRGGEKSKYLVESEGELLLVDYFNALTIDVYRLDEKEKEWVKLTSLGDRVLFLSDGCSFSASALDLCFTKGNCIIFMHDYILDEYCERVMDVFDMDLGRLLPFRRYPHYVNLFWPAPDWIEINCMHNKTKQRALSPYTGAKQRKRT